MKSIFDSARGRRALFAVSGAVDFFLCYKFKQYLGFQVLFGFLAGFYWKGLRRCCADCGWLICGFGAGAPILGLIVMRGASLAKLKMDLGVFLPFAGFGVLLCLPGFAMGVIIGRLIFYGWSKASLLIG